MITTFPCICCGLNCDSPPNLQAEVLTLSNSDYDLIWKQVANIIR